MAARYGGGVHPVSSGPDGRAWDTGTVGGTGARAAGRPGPAGSSQPARPRRRQVLSQREGPEETRRTRAVHLRDARGTVPP